MGGAVGRGRSGIGGIVKEGQCQKGCNKYGGERYRKVRAKFDL
jgi:hypothetical protein